MKGRLIEFKILDSGCIVPTSHKLNHDGYFRKSKSRGEGPGRKPHQMYHRTVYEEMFGDIPEDYEVDHMCKNRACCNPEHLQLLEGTIHAIESNKERYRGKHLDAYTYWIKTNCTGVTLGKVYKVTASSACGWIRDWKRNV